MGLLRIISEDHDVIDQVLNQICCIYETLQNMEVQSDPV
jgi:hypothetical protein